MLLILEGDQPRALRVNESFAELWTEASGQGDFTLESMAKAIQEHYGLDAEAAYSNAIDLITQWQKEGLTEP